MWEKVREREGCDEFQIDHTHIIGECKKKKNQREKKRTKD